MLILWVQKCEYGVLEIMRDTKVLSSHSSSTRDFCITCGFQNPILTFPTHSIYTLQARSKDYWLQVLKLTALLHKCAIFSRERVIQQLHDRIWQPKFYVILPFRKRSPVRRKEQYKILHSNLSKVTRMVLVKVDAMVMLTTSVSTTSRMLPVLSNTSMTMGNVASKLSGLLFVLTHLEIMKR